MFRAIPYFNFQNALEAIDYYVEYFDAEIIAVTKASHEMFEGAPEEYRMTEEEAEKFIMNAEIKILGQSIFISSTWGGEAINNEGVQVAFVFDGENEEAVKEAESFFHKASQSEVRVDVPLGPTAWTKMYGQFQDKYGVDWMISAD